MELLSAAFSVFGGYGNLSLYLLPAEYKKHLSDEASARTVGTARKLCAGAASGASGRGGAGRTAESVILWKLSAGHTPGMPAVKGRVRKMHKL